MSDALWIQTQKAKKQTTKKKILTDEEKDALRRKNQMKYIESLSAKSKDLATLKEDSDIHLRRETLKRHKWTREETIIVTAGYLQKNAVIDTQRLVPSISVGSVRMKYSNSP